MSGLQEISISNLNQSTSGGESESDQSSSSSHGNNESLPEQQVSPDYLSVPKPKLCPINRPRPLLSFARTVSIKSIASQKKSILSNEVPPSQEIDFGSLNEIKTPYIPADATVQEKGIHKFLSSLGVFGVDIQGAISDHNNTQTRISPRLINNE